MLQQLKGFGVRISKGRVSKLCEREANSKAGFQFDGSPNCILFQEVVSKTNIFAVGGRELSPHHVGSTMQIAVMMI